MDLEFPLKSLRAFQMFVCLLFLKGRATEREPVVGSLPKCVQQLGLGQVVYPVSRSLEIHPGLPHHKGGRFSIT